MNTDLRVLIRYLRAFIEKSPSEPFPSLNIAPLNPGVMNKFLLSVLCFLLLNISYCLFTFYHLLQNLDNLTLYGYYYFIAEILVILILSTYELKNARKTRTR